MCVDGECIDSDWNGCRYAKNVIQIPIFLNMRQAKHLLKSFQKQMNFRDYFNVSAPNWKYAKNMAAC